MQIAVRLLTLASLAIFSSVGLAAGLKIQEDLDEFTQERILQSKPFSVCQPKKAGMVPCGTFQLRWGSGDPENVVIRFETGGDYVSLTEIFFRADGQILGYEAQNTTELDYDASSAQFGLGLGRSSANTFVVPIAALEAVATSPASGIVRISGVRYVADYDFYRKHMMKLPHQLLGDFVTRIAEVSKSHDAG